MWKMLDFDQNRFILEVKKRPGLWSLAHPTDRDEKLALWKEVGAAMFKDWKECSKATAYDRVLYLQKKWRSFRDAYRREVRARTTGVRVNRTVYRYYRAMSFLGGLDGEGQMEEQREGADDANEHQVSVSENNDETVCNEDDDDVDGSMEIETLEENEEHLDPYDTDHDPDPLLSVMSTPKPTIIVKRSKKKSNKRRQREVSSEDIEEIQETEVPVVYSLDSIEEERAMEDSDRLFLLSFLPEIKQLPLNIKMWARAKIANIMQEAVTCHYNNTNPDEMGTKRSRRDSSSETK